MPVFMLATGSLVIRVEHLDVVEDVTARLLAVDISLAADALALE